MADHEARFLYNVNSKAQLKYPEYLKQPFYSEQSSL
jgi:hypothetical protein